MEAVKRRVFSVIQVDSDNDLASALFNYFIIALIAVNVLLVLLDTVSGVPEHASRVFRIIDVFSILVFTVEYLLRLWTADYLYPDKTPMQARLAYCSSFMALIDLLVILPFYIPFVFHVDTRVLRMVRVTRILRILRILKINRYTKSLSLIGNVMRARASQLVSSIMVVSVSMLMASVLMYNIEYEAQPEVFDSAFSAMWWAVITIATVGYGDIYPITPMGKLLGAVIALLGIGLVAVPTGIISAGFVEQIENDEDSSKKHYCPYCGKKLD